MFDGNASTCRSVCIAYLGGTWQNRVLDFLGSVQAMVCVLSDLSAACIASRRQTCSGTLHFPGMRSTLNIWLILMFFGGLWECCVRQWRFGKISIHILLNRATECSVRINNVLRQFGMIRGVDFTAVRPGSICIPVDTLVVTLLAGECLSIFPVERNYRRIPMTHGCFPEIFQTMVWIESQRLCLYVDLHLPTCLFSLASSSSVMLG